MQLPAMPCNSAESLPFWPVAFPNGSWAWVQAFANGLQHRLTLPIHSKKCIRLIRHKHNNRTSSGVDATQIHCGSLSWQFFLQVMWQKA